MRLIVNTLSTLVLVFLTTATLLAQPDSDNGGPAGSRNFERIKSARQAFITERLELTEAESDAFFPVFWKYEEELRFLMKEGRPDRKERRERSQDDSAEPLTEAEARRQIEAQLDRMDRMHAIKTSSTKAYLKILPAAKLIELEKANRDFRRELVERLRQRRGERSKRGGGRG